MITYSDNLGGRAKKMQMMKRETKTDVGILHKSETFLRNAVGRIAMLCVLSCLAISASGQNTQHTDNTADQTLRSNGRVNPSTYGMEIDIPLGAYPGRGINVPISVSYSSKVWRLDFNRLEPSNPGCRSLWDPIYADQTASGWTSSMSMPYVEYTGMDNFYDMNGHGFALPCDLSGGNNINPNGGEPIECTGERCNDITFGYIKRIQVHLPSGESHELRASDTPITGAYNTPPTVNWNGTYYAVDGSKLKYVESAGTKRLYLPDGSTYDFAGGSPTVVGSGPNQKNIRKATQYKDINDNTLTYHEPNGTYPNGYWIDTLNRTIPVPIAETPTSPGIVDYVMPGIGGAARTFKFHWKRLKGATAADSGLTNFYDTLKYTGDSSESGIYRNSGDVLFNTIDRNNTYSPSNDPVFNPIVLTAVELPNGQMYQFTYNIYGEINHVEYPTGAYEDFQYQEVKSVGDFGNNYTLKKANRGVTQRDIYESSGATAYTWTYSSELISNAQFLKRIINAPDGTRTERDIYYGEPPCSGCTYGDWGFNNALAGMAFEERSYANNNQIMSKTRTTWDRTQIALTNSSVSPNWHPRVSKIENITYDLSGNALSATQTMSYAGNLNDITNHLDVNLTKQYGYTTTVGGLGVLEKQTEITVMRYDSAINWTEYENRHIIGLPTKTIIKDGAGMPVAQTEIKYDETNYGNGYRGQPTSVKNWLNTNGSWLTVRSKYDTYGNVVETTDANGNSSYIQYNDNFADGINRSSYAFPTKTISAVPGAGGSTSAFETTVKYDFNTGLPISTTDANGQISQMEYNDALLRPTKSIAPNGHQSVTEYGAGTSQATRFVKTKTQIDGTNWKEGYSFYDGLGRTYKTQSVDNTGGGDVFALTCYDGNGRVEKTSNPFRNAANPTCSSALEWTANVYDEAGRVKEVVTPDGAKVQTSYGVATSGSQIGTVVTVKDQALKERRSITNALGQLVRVDEPDVNNNNLLGVVNAPNQATFYEYDTLSNLTKVKQGGTETAPEQTRSFVYDSLSRLKSAQNPESGIISYQYDDNGNLTNKTDARSVQTNYTYDALNRVTQRSYAGEPTTQAATPAVKYYYDNLPYAKGKLIKVENGTLTNGAITNPLSVTEYQAFDQMGRVTQSRQTTDGTAYGAMTYTYNLSGALVEQKYPSGRTVKTTLDADGMLAQVQSAKTANGSLVTYASQFKYTAAGAVSSVRLGNGRFETTKYNSRLQPTQIGLGYSATDTGLLKLGFAYNTAGQNDNNGNVLSQTITVPTEVRNNVTYNGFTATQDYTYDSLNRIKDAKEMTGANQQWKQTFTYDRYGNRRFDEANTTTIQKNCTNGSYNIVCAADVASVNPTVSTANNRLDGYTFDDAGNTKVDAMNRQFTYDAENKQTEVKDANGASIGKYYYDGDGKRVKKEVPATGETTIFVYDASGKMVAEYSTQTNNNPQVSYLTTDHLGSPRINTDASGQVTARHDYQPFGEEITRASYGNDDVRQQFTSYERDNETDLDYAKARMHNFNHGRFTSVDPIMMSKKRLADPQAINLYVYARNNPLRFVDPNGEEFKGTDGNAVIIEREDGRWVIKSDNASKDLQRLVGLVNNSGSSTANSQFNRLNAHKTMINFAFGDKDPQGTALGRHQPHGTRPDGTKGALKFENGKFEGTADIVKDANGNEVYAEATITIYEGEYSGSKQEVEDKMVATFGHEAEHDLDPKQVQETKNKTYRNSVYHPENPDGTPVEGSPYWMSERIRLEIREHRINNMIRRCPPGHICHH